MNRSKRKTLLCAELVLLALLAPSPALRFGGRVITPYGICIASAALLSVILFEWLRLREVRKPKDGPIAVIFRVDALELALLCIPSALIGARLLYVLLRSGYYLFDRGLPGVLCLWEGGFLLYGAAAGALLATIWMAKRKKTSAAGLLDQMAVPGLTAISLCRLAEGFSGEGLGPWIENPAFARFPFAAPNPYGEWQLAVFLFEACFALLAILPLLRMKTGGGRRIAIALLLYACAQVVFESLRMDSCLRIGFVRVSQVMSALVILGATAWLHEKQSGRKTALRRCILPLVCIAVVGGIEWALDKTQVGNVPLYLLMAALCALMAANALYTGREENA